MSALTAHKIGTLIYSRLNICTGKIKQIHTGWHEMVVISSNTASVTGLNQSPVIARRRGIVNFNGGVVYNFRFPFFFFFFFGRKFFMELSPHLRLFLRCWCSGKAKCQCLIELYKAVAGNEPFSKVVIRRIPCQFISSEALILLFCALPCGLLIVHEFRYTRT